MLRRKKYAVLDGFRVAAMLLVIAVHTGPLASFGETADFIFTRVIGRVAVPFFFMVSGYFVLGGEREQFWSRVKRFCTKTAICYGAAIVLYLPLNWYMGDFGAGRGFYAYIQDLLFNGTAYHLWYLPAVLIGILIAALLVQNVKLPTALAATGLLYAVALGGDSYYGLSAQVPFLNAFYNALFAVFSYTRNGLLMAPLFLVLGAAASKIRMRQKPLVIGFCITICLMAAEALALRGLEWQRHDSMYALLPAVMVFLFGLLLAASKAQNHLLRGISTWGYVLHLWVIVALRGFAELVGLRALLVEQSLVHYVVVAAITVVVSVVGVRATERVKQTRQETDPRSRAWAEIDLGAISHNLGELRRALPQGNEVMAVIKANAYGHGDVAVAKHLYSDGVRAFAVATISEGVRLRKAKTRGEILVLGYTAPDCANIAAQHNLALTVCDAAHARALSEKANRPLRVHIKVDTGMHRLGQGWEDHAVFAEICALPYLKVAGLFSHLSACDSDRPADVEFTKCQIARFFDVAAYLKRQGIVMEKQHIQSSYGAVNYPELPCDAARVGILLYGVATDRQNPPPTALNLRPALAVKSRVASLHCVRAGDCVGYGQECRAREDAQVATVCIGYADGIPRNYSAANPFVLIRGQKARIIGRICMDQMLVDVSEIAGISVGDIVTLIGRDGAQEVRCEDLAAACGSITNEILSRLGNRLERIYK